MKKYDFDLLCSFLNLFHFKLVADKNRNEYIVFESSEVCDLGCIEDKTAFEAVENHVHIFDNVKKAQLASVLEFSKRLGELFIDVIHNKFPDKHFVVYVTVDSSVILRFHQKWDDEPWYYIIDKNAYDSTVLYFDC